MIWPSRLVMKNTPTASLQRGKKSVLDMSKQSDEEASVMLKFWGMQSTPLLPSLPDAFWPPVVAPDRVLSMDQIELNCVLMLNWIAWNRTVWTFKLRIYTKLNCLKKETLLVFNRKQIYYWCLIELLVIESDIWNHLTLLTKLNSLK